MRFTVGTGSIGPCLPPYGQGMGQVTYGAPGRFGGERLININLSAGGKCPSEFPKEKWNKNRNRWECCDNSETTCISRDTEATQMRFTPPPVMVAPFGRAPRTLGFRVQGAAPGGFMTVARGMAGASAASVVLGRLHR